MKWLVIVFASIVACSALTLEEQWTDFKLTYKRQYSDPTEELKRFTIFSENVAKIEAHNAKYRSGKVTFYKGMNKFGDLTADEFVSFVNGTKKPAVRLESSTTTRSIEPLTADVDWRTQGVVTPVADQMSCGASYAFSAVGALESQLAIRGGSLTALSAQNIVDCASSGCSEGLQSSAYDYIQSNGIMSAANYPYTGSAGSCSFQSSQSVTSISGHVNAVANEYELINTVQNVGPVAASVHATDYLQFYYGGILFDDTCNTSEGDLNHGVLVIGYGTERLYDFWIVKNSWGTDWGENGFYKSIRNYGNNCGIATRPLYPQL